MKNTILIAVVVVILAVLGFYYIQKTPIHEGQTIQAQSEFKTKIVYLINPLINKSEYEKDCSQRRGTFNSCGSICDIDAEICAEVCAYTCENIGSATLEEYFINKMYETMTEKRGAAVHGYEPFMYLEEIPGLVPEDFEGVQANDGIYEVIEGEVVYNPIKSNIISSAALSVSSQGMKTLLDNLSKRVRIEINNVESIDKLVTSLLEE